MDRDPNMTEETAEGRKKDQNAPAPTPASAPAKGRLVFTCDECGARVSAHLYRNRYGVLRAQYHCKTCGITSYESVEE